MRRRTHTWAERPVHRNRQLENDIKMDKDGNPNWAEDANDRDFVGRRSSGRTNLHGGGGDLYRDLEEDVDALNAELRISRRTNSSRK